MGVDKDLQAVFGIILPVALKGFASVRNNGGTGRSYLALDILGDLGQ